MHTPAAIDTVLDRVNVLHSLHDISGLLIAYTGVLGFEGKLSKLEYK